MTVTVDAQRPAPNHPLGSEAQATPHYQAELSAVASPTPTPQAQVAATVPVIFSHLASSTTRNLDRGEPLYLQGEAAASTYVVEAGLVALSLNARPDRERIIGLAGPGDLVGALTASQGEYLESAHALSQGVAVRTVPVDQLAEASATATAEVNAAMSRAAGEHLARLTRLLEDSETPVPTRVARTLLRLGDRFGQGIDDAGTGAGSEPAGSNRVGSDRPGSDRPGSDRLGADRRRNRRVRLTLPLTHETIANMVGAARETTTSTIEQMRRSGLVHGTRGRYVIDVDGLTDYANETAAAS